MISVVARDTTPKQGEQSKRELRIVDRVLRYVGDWDSQEESRRRSDRLGARLFYGHHWGVSMPDGRSAITINVVAAILKHKVAIMTKQDPIPVIEPQDAGDAQAARIMRSIIMRRWVDDNMKIKLRRALLLAGSTRTSAWKICWDPQPHGWAGDTTTDTLPGWRLIVDNCTNDPDQMEYFGDRALMPRSKAMLLYPEAAKKLRGDTQSKDGYRQESGGTTFIAQEGVSGPWGPRIAPVGAPTLVNGKPVVTAFAGAPAGVSGRDMVEVVELYYRDRMAVKVIEHVRDEDGNPKQEIVMDEDDNPVFTELPDEIHTLDDGTSITMPAYRLEMRDVMVERLVPKYPFYRRSTVLLPDGILLEDTAWDYPNPYCYFNDEEPLEGILSKGSILAAQQMQSALNVTGSSMMDQIRMGVIKAFFAGTTSGLATDVVVARPGQIIPVGDPKGIEPVPNEQVSDQMFKAIAMWRELIEFVMGATGIMQGEAQGRIDSSSGYDTLAEIGGARMVDATQRMEVPIARWAMLVGMFAQQHYTDKHFYAMEDETGVLMPNRVSRADLQGALSYRIATGSTLAWSESAMRGRLIQELQQGLIDKPYYWEATKTPNWKALMKRMLTEAQQSPILLGGGQPAKVKPQAPPKPGPHKALKA